MSFIFVGALFCLLVLYAGAGLGKSCHSPSEPLQASVGEHFSLNCSITEGSISWLYNNIPLKESQDISTSLNGVLKIFSVKLEHAGWYTCTAGDETGRQEADYLLIVIVEPQERKIVSVDSEFMYTTMQGSQVELPCVIPGHTSPITWSKDGETIENSQKYSIVQLTGSLIIKDVTAADFSGSFQCNDDPNSFYNVTVLNDTDEVPEASLLQSYVDDDAYVIQNRTLMCIESRNESYVIRWTKNLKDINDNTNINSTGFNNTLTVTSSGFYCCQLEDVYNFTFCATVIVPDIILPSSVSLPANRGRTINILCQVFPDNDIYNMYQLTWDGLGMDDMMPLGDMNSYIYYQRSACMSLNITCIGESFSEFSNESRTTDATIIISVVELSNARNLLKGYTADFSNRTVFNSIWIKSQGAGYDMINGETVFYVNRTSHKLASLQQKVRIPPFSSSIFVSGRMRQEFSGEAATIAIQGQGKPLLSPLYNPFMDSEAWQWVSGEASLSELDIVSRVIGLEVTFLLLVKCSSDCSEAGMNSPIDKIAYFDDLHLSSQLDKLLLSITVVLVVIIITVVLTIVLLICKICHSYRRRKKKVTISMDRGRKKGASLDFQSELTAVLNKCRETNPSFSNDLSENSCVLPSNLTNSGALDVMASSAEHLVTSTAFQPTTSSIEEIVHTVSHTKLNLLPAPQTLTDVAAMDEDDTAGMITNRSETTSNNSVSNNSVQNALKDSRIQDYSSSPPTLEIQDPKDMLESICEESSRGNREVLENNHIYDQPSTSVTSDEHLVVNSGADDSSTTPLTKDYSKPTTKNSTEYDYTMAEDLHNERRPHLIKIGISDGNNSSENEQKAIAKRKNNSFAGLTVDVSPTIKNQRAYSFASPIHISSVSNNTDDSPYSTLTAETIGESIYDQPVLNPKRISSSLTSHGYSAIIEAAHLQNEAQLVHPSSKEQQDLLCPKYDYSKAADVGRELNSNMFSNSSKTVAEPTRRRSDSLTSQGYVDVSFVGATALHSRSRKEVALQSTAQAPSDGGVNSRPLSAELPNEGIYDEPIFNPRRRLSSLTNEGYVAVNMTQVKAHSTDPLREIQEDTVLSTSEYDYSKAADTDGKETLSMSSRKGRTKDEPTRRLPDTLASEGYVGLVGGPTLQSRSLRELLLVTNAKSQIQIDQGVKSRPLSAGLPDEDAPIFNPRRRSSSLTTDQEIYDQPIFKLKNRSDSLTSQGYVAVEVHPTSHLKHDSDYEYSKAKDIVQELDGRTDALQSQGYAGARSGLIHPDLLENDEEYCYISPLELHTK